jgi:hypothetical protein
MVKTKAVFSTSSSLKAVQVLSTVRPEFQLRTITPQGPRFPKRERSARYKVAGEPLPSTTSS